MTGTIERAVARGSQRGTEGSVTVTVNGSDREVAAASSLADLLSALTLDPRSVVVEHNSVIIRDRALLPSLKLEEGDVVEIVHFVGGG